MLWVYGGWHSCKENHNAHCTYHKKVIFERKIFMAKESEIIFYQGDDGNIRIEVFYHDDTFWMTQKK